MTARAVTDLPEPLSPTRAIVWPLRSWNETSRTASIVAAVDLEGDADPARVDHDVAEGLGCHVHGLSPQYGSIASRRPSPSALNAKTVTSTKPTGERIHG